MWRPDLRSIGLVTAVTLLVWVWAEGESLRRESVTAPIQLTGRSDLVVKAEDAFGGSVLVELEGSNLAVSEASGFLLGSTLELKPGEGAVPAEPGTHTLTLRTVLREHPELRTRGVAITGVEPPRLTITLMRLVTRELPVRVDLPAGFADSQSVTVRPSTVRVTMPETVAQALPEGAAPFVRVPEAQLHEVLPGARPTITGLTVELPDELDGLEHVRVEPARVEVTVAVRSQIDTYEIATVPVWVALPPTQTDRWTVELEDQFLSNVQVSGPRDLIARVKSGELAIKALVELDTQDLEARIEQKAVKFSMLPTGLTFPQPAPVVGLRITPRADGPPGGVNGTGP